MKTLIISDIHLTHHFDEKKYLFLENLFLQHDAIILNGDFWDGFSTTFNQFVSSKWSGLFPLLKSKGAIYLFGNHDHKEYMDERVNLFSIMQKENHLLEIGSDIYHIEHGHMLEPGIDGIIPLSRSLLKYINFTTHIIENILVRLGSPQNIIMKQANKAIKKKLHKKQFPHWYLCGHTHVAEFDKPNKFANSGFVQYGKASYLIVDSSGPSLQTEWYK
jgi:predicted phosphodiesterase